MATTTLSKPRGISRGRWITAGIAVIVIAIVAALFFNRPVAPSAASTSPSASVGRGSIVASVAGTGTISADQSIALSFPINGSVTNVLVEEGDTVVAGQVLARLDDRELQLSVRSAEASLESARARLEQSREGNASEQELAASQASLANAEANLVKTRTGNTTAADIAETEAQLRSAQAQLDELLAGPDADSLASAQASYDQSVANLDSQRTSLSTAKTRAASELEQSANTLRDRQAEYSKLYWDNRKLESLPGDLPQANKDSEAEALRAVANAEESLHQAELAADQAKQDEITGLAQAESQLREAEQKLRTAKDGPTKTEIIQAQSSVDQAKASLQRLRQGGTAADIAASQASVDQARANLAQLSEPATATDLRIEDASVAQAEQSLEQARLQLEQAVLKAPFGGIVSAVDIVPGSVLNGGAAFSLLDRDPLHVDLKLSENDVARVALGQPVELTVDAIADLRLAGEVSYIAPAAETENGVVTYLVRVMFDADDPTVKVGMTANLSIVYAQKDNVLLVPNSALLPKGNGRVVQVPGAEGTTSEVEVTTGLSDGTYTEVLSGLSEGQAIVATPSQAERPSGGLFGN